MRKKPCSTKFASPKFPAICAPELMVVGKVNRTRRVEGGEGAVARAQETVIHHVRVNVEPRNLPRGVNAIWGRGDRARNVERREDAVTRAGQGVIECCSSLAIEL